MKQLFKRTLCGLLALVMTLSVLPASVFAAQESEPETAQTESIPTVQSEEYSLSYVGLGTAASSLSGSGTAASPYLIQDGYDLLYFASQVNNGNPYAGKYIRLTNNLDMSGVKWTPIGISSTKCFSGTFDGDGHEIINLDLTYSTGEVDSAAQFVGFFGYANGAKVRNFGLRQYVINQPYNYDTSMGAMVGHAQNSSFTDCYTDGGIRAYFTKINPLERSDVITLTPTSLSSEVSYTNARGQGVILDLRNLSSTTVNKAVTISGDVSALRIIGSANKTYTGFTVLIASSTKYDFYLELVDVNLSGNSSASYGSTSYSGNIIFPQERELCIYSKGSGNSITNTVCALNAPSANVHVVAEADLSFTGKAGSRGTDGSGYISVSDKDWRDGEPGNSGGKGGDGYTPVNVAGLYVYDGTVTITGGAGGQGGTGADGANGYSYPQNHDNRTATGTGARGGHGGKGGTGGQGGAGAAPINASAKIYAYGTLNLIGGAGGKGGTGGKGGNGGQGQETGGWGKTGGKGGNAGAGGKGGASGLPGLPSFTNYTAGADGIISAEQGAYGSGGSGGSKGSPGSGGTHSNIRDSKRYWATWGYKGSSGDPADDGAVGDVTTRPNGTPTSDFVTGPLAGGSHVPSRFSFACITLNAGGFCGFAGSQTQFVRCASVVNDIKNGVSDTSTQAPIYTGQPVNLAYCGNFVGNYSSSNNAYWQNLIAAYRQDGVLYKYVDANGGNGCWFGGAAIAVADMSVSVLNNQTDSQGLTYDNGIAAGNSIAPNATITGKTGSSCHITVPEYVFSGRYIRPVTAIADKAFYANRLLQDFTGGQNLTTIGAQAFYESSISNFFSGRTVRSIGKEAFGFCPYLENATLGDSVSYVGEKLFSHCPRLRTITIGKALTEIPEFNSQKISDCTTPFGIDKTNSLLERYIVSDENTAFASVDNVLCERFTITYPDGTQTHPSVAIIDAPVYAAVENGAFAPSDYIVRIFPGAFENNKTVKTVTLPHIREVGNAAFKDCTALTQVTFPDLETTDETIQILDQTYPKATESYSTFVGINAFYGCTKLSGIDLSSRALTKIGVGAFANCATAEGIPALSVTIGPNITVLGAGEQELNGDVTTSNSDLFRNGFATTFMDTRVKAFQAVDLDGVDEAFFAENGILYYRPGTKDSDGKPYAWLAVYPNYAEAESFTVQNTDSSAFTVNYISPYAFTGNYFLKTLRIGTGVTQIGAQAFENMRSLSRLELGKDTLSFSSPSTSFDGCRSLSTISVDGENPYYASVDGVFYNKSMTALFKYPAAKMGADYTMPEAVTSIGDSAFHQNPYIRHIMIPGIITYVGGRAFNICPSLSFIYFSNPQCDAPVPMIDEQNGIYANMFYTSCTRSTLICYENETAGWKNLENGTYNGYQFKKYSGLPSESDYEKNGYYAFVVADKSGALLNGMNVALEGSGQAINTKDGIAIFYDLDYDKSYALTVMDNEAVYFPVVNSEFYLDEATRITYITMSSVPTVAGVSVSYTYTNVLEESDTTLGAIAGEFQLVGGKTQTHDINSETAPVNRHYVDDITIKLSAGYDADSTLSSVRLVQNGAVLKTLVGTELTDAMEDITQKGKTVSTITIPVSVAMLSDGGNISAVVEITDASGNVDQVTTPLRIQVFTLKFLPLNMNFVTNKLTYVVPNDFPLVGGTSIQLTSDKFQPVVNVGMGPDYFRVIINDEALTKDFNFGNNYGFNSKPGGLGADTIKNVTSWDELLRLQSDIQKGKIKEASKENKVGLSIGGYYELRFTGLDENGMPKFDSNVNITGKLEYTIKTGTTMMVWVIPVRLEAQFNVYGELEFNLVYDHQEEKLEVPELDLNVYLGLTASAGIGCKAVSGGVYGKLETEANFGIIPEFKLKQWLGYGDIGAYFKVDMLFFKLKKEWSFFGNNKADRTLNIYKDGRWFWQTSRSGGTQLLNSSVLFDERNYEMVLSQVPKLLAQETAVTHTTYSGSAPKYLRVGSTVYIFYHDDGNWYNSTNYDAYNYQKIVWQVYDLESQTLTAPRLLDDNGLADGAFELYWDGTNVHVVYNQMATKAGTNDIENISSTVSAMEVKTAILADGTFAPAENTLTNDAYYDMHLRMGILDGKPAAVWVRNEENTALGETVNNNQSIWFSVFAEDTWSEPAPLAENLGTVTDLAVGVEQIAYITDGNNDLATIGDQGVEAFTDRTITVLATDGSVLWQTAQEAGYHDVTCLDGTLTYYLEGNLYQVMTGTALLETAIPTLPDNYQLLTDAAGNVTAIVYVSTVDYGETNGSNLFGIFRKTDGWGQPIQLTDYGEGVYISAFDATDNGSQMLLSVLLSQLQPGTETIDGMQTYETVNVLDTALVDYPTEVTLGEFIAQPDTMIPNQTGTVLVEIHNTTPNTLTQLPVTVSGCGASTQMTVTTFRDKDGNALSGGLPSGESAYIALTFNPGAALAEDHTFVIGTNTIRQRLWHSDFDVFGKQIVLGGKHYIVAYISNKGHISASYTLSAAVNESETGEAAVMGQALMDPITTKQLAYEENQHILIPIEVTAENPEFSVILSLNATEEVNVANNQTNVNVTLAEESDLTMDTLSIWLSENTVQLDRSALEDVTVSYDHSCTLLSVSVNGSVYADNTLYTGGADCLTLNSRYIADNFENGTIKLLLTFDDGTNVAKTAALNVVLTQFFQVRWDVDGAITTESCEIGTTPTHADPEKPQDAAYTYTFAGWDSNGDGTVDGIGQTLGDTTYTAVFAPTLRSYTVTWQLSEEQQITQSVPYGQTPAFAGETPTRESTAQNVYTFSGWSPAVTAVTGDITYTAQFKESVRKYVVTTKVEDQITNYQVEYGKLPTLPTPEKAADEKYVYTFAGWDHPITTVYGNQTYIGSFNATLRQYTVGWDVEGTLTEGLWDYGTLPQFPTVPEKAADAQYTYTFSGWTPLVVAVTENALYKAQFEATLNSYTVTWIVNDIRHDTVWEYGQLPSFTGSTQKQEDVYYGYTFTGWDKPIAPVIGDAVYTAQYEATALDRNFLVFAGTEAVAGFVTLAEALEAYDPETQFIRLAADAPADLVLSKDLYIDLAGHTLSGQMICGDYRVYGMDSTTDSYTCQNMGSFQCTDPDGNEIVPVLQLRCDNTGATKRYLALRDESGWTFHRFYLGITHMSLAPKTSGVGYKARFCGDDMVLAALDPQEAFGYVLTLGDYLPVTRSMDVQKLTNDKTVTLRVERFNAEDYGQTDLKAQVYLKLADGTLIESSQYSMTLRSLAEKINAIYTSFSQEQLAAIAAMIEANPIMKTWGLDNLA